MLSLSTVPRCLQIVDSLLFKRTMGGVAREIERAAGVVERACNEIRQSQGWIE
jgi:hypothetical protein